MTSNKLVTYVDNALAQVNQMYLKEYTREECYDAAKSTNLSEADITLIALYFYNRSGRGKQTLDEALVHFYLTPGKYQDG